jgi:hypothetical protein
MGPMPHDVTVHHAISPWWVAAGLVGLIVVSLVRRPYRGLLVLGMAACLHISMPFHANMTVFADHTLMSSHHCCHVQLAVELVPVPQRPTGRVEVLREVVRWEIQFAGVSEHRDKSPPNVSVLQLT